MLGRIHQWIHIILGFSLLLLLPSRFSRVQLCAIPQTAAHQAPPSLLVLSISPFSSVHVCFIYWALIFGAHICKITVSSWWIDLFFIIDSLLYVSFKNFYLKSILSDISIAILAPFGYDLEYFTFNSCMSLDLKWISWRKHIVGYCFLFFLF